MLENYEFIWEHAFRFSRVSLAKVPSSVPGMERGMHITPILRINVQPLLLRPSCYDTRVTYLVQPAAPTVAELDLRSLHYATLLCLEEWDQQTSPSHLPLGRSPMMVSRLKNCRMESMLLSTHGYFLSSLASPPQCMVAIVSTTGPPVGAVPHRSTISALEPIYFNTQGDNEPAFNESRAPHRRRTQPRLKVNYVTTLKVSNRKQRHVSSDIAMVMTT
ncbi:hypothetical protein BC835DRAFT_866428 [Cytidiella melzeri]|nr:hypothetical protein BC835DRAFT_866428 [Cytidiella melzeri]